LFINLNYVFKLAFVYKGLITLLLLLVAPYCSIAQLTPAEGRALSYRIIGFSFPNPKNTDRYTLEIAAGNYNNEDFFQKNIIITQSSRKNKIIAEVPSFGTPYTWRVTYTDDHASVTKSELHHFTTVMLPEVNKDSARLRILTPAIKNKDLYVFVDASKTLYTMDGTPVWCIQPVEGIPTRVLMPRDLKCSGLGTITFMWNEQAYEINYDGDVLWKEPGSGPKSKKITQKITSLHHHEFTRLSNGHYMTLGMELVNWEVQGTIDTSKVRFKQRLTVDSNGKLQQKVFCGKIIEFDRDHNIVWSWSAADYFKKSDMYYRRLPNGLFRIGNTHENAFYFDEKAKVIYISFRNIHRVIKVQYPSGKVLNTYGELYIPGNQEMKNDLFCGQHNVRRSQDGYLYLFNNNGCNRLCGQLPTIIMLQEPATSKGQLKKVWEYECTLDSMTEQEQAKLRFETGGSVFELPDRSILCCMAGNYSKVFIVNRDKKITWSALPEQWSLTEKKWKALPGYRASIITRQELESLIWGEPLKKK